MTQKLARAAAIASISALALSGSAAVANAQGSSDDGSSNGATSGSIDSDSLGDGSGEGSSDGSGDGSGDGSLDGSLDLGSTIPIDFDLGSGDIDISLGSVVAVGAAVGITALIAGFA